MILGDVKPAYLYISNYKITTSTEKAEHKKRVSLFKSLGKQTVV